MIYAASSLRDVLEDLAENFEAKEKVNIKFNFTSSGTLARQIEQGAEADIYISANSKWMTHIEQLGKLKDSSKISIAENSLVLITNKSNLIAVSKDDLYTTLLLNKIAIGDPNHVPAGIYAKQALSFYTNYQEVEGNLVPTKDVRSALMLAELDEVSFAVVYRTDALQSAKVKILFEFEQESHDAISYDMALCSDKKIAKDFYLYLNSKESEEIWGKYSFKK